MNQKQAKKALENMGFKYDGALSNNESKVFISPDGTPNIAMRGSHRLSDWALSDTALLFGLGKYDRRFKEAREITNLVEQTYNKPANIFGHSLAGRLAEHSGAHGNITTYNKGVGIFDIGKTIPRNQTDYRTTDDIVSALAPTQHHKGRYFEIPTYGTGFIEAHNIR